MIIVLLINLKILLTFKIFHHVWRYPFGPPRYIHFFEPFHFFTAGDQLVVPVGVSHISLRYKNTIEGAEEKRTNEQYAWVNSNARKELCNTAFPVCMCRLTLAWILAKIL